MQSSTGQCNSHTGEPAQLLQLSSMTARSGVPLRFFSCPSPCCSISGLFAPFVIDCVNLGVMLRFFRQGVVLEDSLNGTNRLAGPTINTLLRGDKELIYL